MMRSPGSFPGVGIVYLFRDEFTTPESAPIASPRTAEPGPGTWTVTDTGNHLSIIDGELQAGGIAATSDPRILSNAFSRSAGVCLKMIARRITGVRQEVGFDGMVFYWDGPLVRLNNLAINIAIGTGSPGFENIEFGFVLRPTGCICIVDGKIIWISVEGDGPQSVVARNASLVGSPTFGVSRAVVSQLGGGWATDYGIATNRIATTSAGNETTSEANAIIEHTITAATGITQELDIRRTDADNRWIVRMDQAGGTVKLIERNGGTETERSSAAQTWTNGTAYRVVTIQDGATIRTYVANVAKNTYASATFNQSATGVRVSHAGSNLVCWPRNLSGAALAALEAI